MKKSLFIAFEGIDGSGKSTQSKLLTERFENLNHEVHHTFEPTNNEIGAIIRQIIRGEKSAHQTTIAGLFVADRLDHLLHDDYGMIQYLLKGTHVISDRYYLSSYAYHAVFMDMDWVIQANGMSAKLKRPDINIFIDINPEVALERIQNSRSQMDIYESLNHLNKVRENYFIAFDKVRHQENIWIVDGDQSQDSLSDMIWNKISTML